MLCSVVSAFFYLRVAVLMFMTDAQESAPGRFPAAVSAALVLAAFVTIVGGIFPGTLRSLGVGATVIEPCMGMIAMTADYRISRKRGLC